MHPLRRLATASRSRTIPARADPSRAARLDLVGIGLLAARGGRRILDGIDLVLAPGERLAIVGPNGAGKTSLIRLLFDRSRPSEGRILLDGRDLSGVAPAERGQTIAVVGQSDVPDPRLTLREYVSLGRLPHRGRCPARRHDEIVGQACEAVGLSSLLGRRLGTLSGGERQRGAIARAVAQEPALLVLDEPTNHLDPRARADMLALARDLGPTVVAVLHDLALVAPFADRVAVLDRGRLAALGTPDEALSPETVARVFAMACFPFRNPATGRPLLVFDTPA